MKRDKAAQIRPFPPFLTADELKRKAEDSRFRMKKMQATELLFRTATVGELLELKGLDREVVQPWVGDQTVLDLLIGLLTPSIDPNFKLEAIGFDLPAESLDNLRTEGFHTIGDFMKCEMGELANAVHSGEELNIILARLYEYGIEIRRD